MLIGWQAMMIGALALGAYSWALRAYGPGTHARTVALFALIGAQLGHMFNCRSRTRSALNGIFRNPFIWVAALIVVLLQFLAISFSPLAAVLGTHPLAGVDWLVVGFSVVAPVIIVEIFKAAVRSQSTRIQSREGGASWSLPK